MSGGNSAPEPTSDAAARAKADAKPAAKPAQAEVPTDAQPETATGTPIAPTNTGTTIGTYTPATGSTGAGSNLESEATGPYAPVPIPQSLAGKNVPNPGGYGDTTTTRVTSTDQALTALATYYKIKAKPGGPPLEELVLQALSAHYGVPLDKPYKGSDPKGTPGPGGGPVGYAVRSAEGVPGQLAQYGKDLGGSAQALPGQVESSAEGVASGVEGVAKGVNKGVNAVEGAFDQLLTGQNADQTKGKPAPKGRGRKPDTTRAPDRTAPPPTDNPTDQFIQENTAALAKIAAKMGITDPGKNPLLAMALTESTKTAANDSLATIPGATAAEQYAYFVNNGFNPKTGALTADGKKWESTLLNSGYLNVEGGGGTPTAANVQNAYLSMLGVAVNGNQTGDPNTTVPAGTGVAGVIAAGQAAQAAIDNSGGPSETYNTVAGVAAEFGVYLSPLQINQIANDPVVAGEVSSTGSPSSVENTIKAMVIAQYNPDNPNNPAGVANTMYMGIQSASNDYQIPMGPDQINQMVKSGLQTASVAYPASAATDVVNKATQLLQEQAKALYPTLTAQIDQGSNVKDLMAPYQNVAAAYTGVPLAEQLGATAAPGGGPKDASGQAVGATPSKWAAFLQGGNDPATGAPTLMTLDQWKKTLMTNTTPNGAATPDYGFKKTQGAQDMAEQLSSAILNAFGRVNTGDQSNPFGAYNPNSALAANT